MQLQGELLHSLPQLSEKPLGVILVLESNNEIIGPPRDDNLSTRRPFPPLLYPEVEDVVQVNIRQQRRNCRSLGRPFLACCPLDPIHDACAQPLADESQ